MPNDDDMGCRFKLEALLRFRCHEEEDRQKELAVAQWELEASLERLDEQLNLRTFTELEFEQQQRDATTGPHATMYRTYLNQLSEQIVQRRCELLASRQHVEKTREALLAAMKKRKALDKLKEKEMTAYRQECNRRELEFIDEMAINRYARNQQ